MRGRNRRWWMIALVVIASVFVGNLVGEALQNSIPLLGKYAQFGFEPQTINLLGVVSFTLGVSFSINLTGALGAIAALLSQRL